MAREAVYFPDGKSSNILRGAFGTIFRKITCVPQCSGARGCQQRGTCPYAQLFEPRALNQEGPSGFADHPRPFVFRAMHLDGHAFEPGQTFHFDLHLFEPHTNYIAYFVLAFSELAREGLGPQRSKVELATVSTLNAEAKASATIYQNGLLQKDAAAQTLRLDLRPDTQPVSRVCVRFLTPTELKNGQQIAVQPEFPILACRIRDRVSLLRELYGEGPLDIDFKAFGVRAAQVKTTSAELRHVDLQRRSSKTGQVHSIGGFVGEAAYEGPLAEFVPFLKAARWTGVGRQTVWGKGEIAMKIG